MRLLVVKSFLGNITLNKIGDIMKGSNFLKKHLLKLCLESIDNVSTNFEFHFSKVFLVKCVPFFTECVSLSLKTSQKVQPGKKKHADY